MSEGFSCGDTLPLDDCLDGHKSRGSSLDSSGMDDHGRDYCIGPDAAG